MELKKKPGAQVTCVDHHEIYAAQFCHFRCIAKTLNNVIDSRLIQLAVVLPKMPRTCARPPDGPVIVLRISTSTRVNQFDSGKGIVLFDRICRRVQVRQHLWIVQRDAELMRYSCF